MGRIVSPRAGNTNIKLQTRLGTDIPNTQAWELTPLDWKTAVDLRKKDAFKDPKFVKFLSKSCPIYKCHGLTFASRRTQPDYSCLPQILKEDGYQEVACIKFEKDGNGKANRIEDVQTGDVAVYYGGMAEEGIVHTGIVVDVTTGSGCNIRVPRVWSKWGLGPEVVHHYMHCPYDPIAMVQFYRMTQCPTPAGICP